MFTKFVPALLDAVDALVMVLDRQGRVIRFNLACEQATCYSFDEVEGKYIWEVLLPPEQAEPVKALFEQLLSSSGPSSYESYCLTKNGTRRLIAWSNTALLDERGSLEYIVATGTDITERREAEEALEVSENNYRAIFDAANEIIFVHDLSTLELIDINQKACEMFGYTREELRQMSINDLSLGELPYTQAEAVQWIQKAVTTGEPQLFEWLSKHKTGQLFWTEVNLKQALIGGRDCLLVISRNITERKQAEEALRRSEAQLRQQTQELTQALEELKQAQAQLVQSEKMSGLGQLVAGIAHEINNPVNFVYGNLKYAREYTEYLLRLLHLYQQHYPNPSVEISAGIEAIELDFVTEDLPKIMDSMQSGTDRIRQIVLSLRNFSRHDEAEMKLVNIHEGLDSTLLLLQHRLEASTNGIGIQVIKEYGDLPLVECYAGQLNQAFMNILTNAIAALRSWEVRELESHQELKNLNEQPQLSEFTSSFLNLQTSKSQTSWIRIGTEVIEPNQVRIRIADSGIGMTEEVQSRLYDPFFTTKPVGKGTGLGLSISYQIIIEKHGGQLECVSAPGQGAEFFITIPILHQKQKLLEAMNAIND